jgi:hypothetical protein
MGGLAMGRTGPCGTESPPTPAFDEIVSIVAPAMDGNFDGPVDSAEPPLLPMHLQRLPLQDQPAYLIKIDDAARAMITISGRKSGLHELSNQQHDTVRLLLARVLEKPPVAHCTTAEHYRLQVDTDPAISAPDCGFPERQLEFHALTTLLEGAFGV